MKQTTPKPITQSTPTIEIMVHDMNNAQLLHTRFNHPLTHLASQHVPSNNEGAVNYIINGHNIKLNWNLAPQLRGYYEHLFSEIERFAESTNAMNRHIQQTALDFINDAIPQNPILVHNIMNTDSYDLVFFYARHIRINLGVMNNLLTEMTHFVLYYDYHYQIPAEWLGITGII